MCFSINFLPLLAKFKSDHHTVLTLVVLVAQAKSGLILYVWTRKGPHKSFVVIQPFFHWKNLVFLTFWVMRTTFEVRS